MEFGERRGGLERGGGRGEVGETLVLLAETALLILFHLFEKDSAVLVFRNHQSVCDYKIERGRRVIKIERRERLF